mmetsp:Transcript_1608/g.2275  ORF Transcript_1608/g.2275 Transcript_1608/m.2275 type:complete len:405 (-) Transcript_1608:336-1550(-)
MSQDLRERDRDRKATETRRNENAASEDNVKTRGGPQTDRIEIDLVGEEEKHSSSSTITPPAKADKQAVDAKSIGRLCVLEGDEDLIDDRIPKPNEESLDDPIQILDDPIQKPNEASLDDSIQILERSCGVSEPEEELLDHSIQIIERNSGVLEEKEETLDQSIQVLERVDSSDSLASIVIVETPIKNITQKDAEGDHKLNIQQSDRELAIRLQAEEHALFQADLAQQREDAKFAQEVQAEPSETNGKARAGVKRTKNCKRKRNASKLECRKKRKVHLHALFLTTHRNPTWIIDALNVGAENNGRVESILKLFVGRDSRPVFFARRDMHTKSLIRNGASIRMLDNDDDYAMLLEAKRNNAVIVSNDKFATYIGSMGISSEFLAAQRVGWHLGLHREFQIESPYFL